MYDRRKSLRRHTHSPEVSGLVTSERKSHLLTHERGEGSDDGNVLRVRPHTLATDSSLSDASVGRKRKRHHAGTPQKKLKTSSVESRTVSVTRISTPIYEDGSVNLLSSLGPENDSSTAQKDLSPEPKEGSESAMDSPSVSPAKDKRVRGRQRKFRVSLTLPDDSGKRGLGTPDIKSPLLNSSSSCERPSGLAHNKRSPSFESDLCFTSPVSAQNSNTMPFLASSLPAVSTKQVETDSSTVQTKAPVKANHVSEHPQVLKPSVSSPVSVNVPVSKSLNQQTMFDGHSAEMRANVSTSFIGTVDTHPGNVTSTEDITSSNFSSDVTGMNTVSGGPVSLAPVVIASLDSVASVVVTSSDPTPLASSQVELGGSKNHSGRDPSSNLAALTSSGSVMNVGGKTNNLSASLNLDVGVTGKSVDASLSNPTNPVPISSIEVPTHEGVDSTADAAIGVSSHPRDPALSSPMPASSHSTIPSTSSSVTGSFAFVPASSEEPVLCSENSTGVFSKVNQSASTSHQNKGELCTNQPAAQGVALTQRSEEKYRPPAERVQGTVRTQDVHKEVKPQNPTGAPTPVITKTPPQLRGQLPEVQQIVMSDKPTKADQLPPAAEDNTKAHGMSSGVV